MPKSDRWGPQHACGDVLKNARSVAAMLARLSLDPYFCEARREHFKMLAGQVLEDMAYVETLASTGRLEGDPFVQLEVAPRVADEWLEAALERARRNMQEARGLALLQTLERPRNVN